MLILALDEDIPDMVLCISEGCVVEVEQELEWHNLESSHTCAFVPGYLRELVICVSPCQLVHFPSPAALIILCFGCSREGSAYGTFTIWHRLLPHCYLQLLP